MGHSVIDWLLEQGVRRGHPEDIVSDTYDASKKEVIKKLMNPTLTEGRGNLSRKLRRNLTINI